MKAAEKPTFIPPLKGGFWFKQRHFGNLIAKA